MSGLSIHVVADLSVSEKKCFNTQGTIRAGVAPASSTIVINCLALSNHEHNLVNSYIATYVGSLSLHFMLDKTGMCNASSDCFQLKTPLCMHDLP